MSSAVAGLFGLGGPEMIALVVIGGFMLVTVAVVLAVVLIVVPRSSKSKPAEDED